jgi:hypothetical protein
MLPPDDSHKVDSGGDDRDKIDLQLDNNLSPPPPPINFQGHNEETNLETSLTTETVFLRLFLTTGE